jgi:DNA repair exonuclease SbcCD ATPase subunit
MNKYERLEKLRKLLEEYRELYKSIRDGKVIVRYNDMKVYGSISVYFEWMMKELARVYKKLDKLEEKLDDAEEEMQTERMKQAQFEVMEDE